MMPTALLRQTVRVEPYAGEAASGPLYDASASYPARVEPGRRLVRSTEDAAVVSDAVAYLRPDAVVAVGDRVTVSGIVYRVLAVDAGRGLLRDELLRVSLGRSAK
jgi:hypothetical protein